MNIFFSFSIPMGSFRHILNNELQFISRNRVDHMGDVVESLNAMENNTFIWHSEFQIHLQFGCGVRRTNSPVTTVSMLSDWILCSSSADLAEHRKFIQ